MKRCIILIVLFLTLKVLAQPLRETEKLLKNKSFPAFRDFIDNHQKSNATIGWKTLRQIMPGYQEGVIEIEEIKTVDDGTGSSVNNYKINLLATEEKIIYYDFTKTVYKNTGNNKWEFYSQTIDKFKNEDVYKNFENAFINLYRDTLHQNELFVTDIVYGSHCGITGTIPAYREILNNFLLKGDIDLNRHWLTSANAEKQLYALSGFRTLTFQGYQLTDDEKRLIEIIKQKKGSVKICSGCMYIEENFEQLISQIASASCEEVKMPKISYPALMRFSGKKVIKYTNNISVNTIVTVIVLLSFSILLYFKRKNNLPPLTDKSK